MIIALSMISTSMHAVEDLIEKHSLHMNSHECNTHAHLYDHEHMHTHNNSTHSHSHGEHHSSTVYFFNNLDSSLFTLKLSCEQFQFIKLQFPNPTQESLFRPPIS